MSKTLTGTAQRSQMSGGTQLAESAQGSTPVNLLPPQPGSPPRLGVATAPAPAATPAPQGIDLQDAMDRESQIDDLLDDAMKKIPASQEALVPVMP
jgi:hypothetical protein